MRKPVRRLAVKKPLVLALALAVLSAAAGTALAVNLSGDGTLVGCSAAGTTKYCTTADDTLNAGSGNDVVWGLAGSDMITAGNGNDVIDGDGQCPRDDEGQRFPHGIPGTNQCEHGETDSSSQRDSITAGNGNDTIFGGGGRNTITVGCGDDVVYGGPIGDIISAGRGCKSQQPDDRIYLGVATSYEGSVVTSGPGDSVIHAQNGVRDAITCQGPNGTIVYADKTDSVTGCARVIYTRDPTPRPVRDRIRATRPKHHDIRTHKRRNHLRTHNSRKDLS